jgi:hypothetical protein
MHFRPTIESVRRIADSPIRRHDETFGSGAAAFTLKIAAPEVVQT